MLEAALAYAAIGWPVFPCNRRKEPCFAKGTKYGKGVEHATTDPAQIREMWAAFPTANIGCHVGAAGMMVVDTDPGHNIEEVHRAFEGLPDTKLMQLTPRGGDHRFYALAEGEQVALSGSKVAPHVDIRSHNSYVLLAPSVTEDGAYTWAHETTYPPQPMPKPAYRTDKMVQVCGAKREKAANAAVWLIAPDMPENLDAAMRWLQSDACRPAIEGQGGDGRTKDTAAMMRSFGLSEATALNLLFEVYNAKCDPPWDYDELAVKVGNGYRYATSAPGNMTTAYRNAIVKAMFKASEVILPSGIERSSGRYRIVDRAGIEHIKDPEWLIPDTLPKGGHATLSGPPGTFKTFIALDMLMSVAAGSAEGKTTRPWPTIKESGPVLLAVGEGRAGLKIRIEAWEKQHNAGKPVSDMVLMDPVPLVSAGATDWEAFCDLALSLSPEGYVLVVIDTAGRAMQGVNENSQEHASMLTQLVGVLQRRLSCAVLVIHHTGHGDQTRAKGSGVFGADADTSLVTSRDGKLYAVEISMSKQKDGREWDRSRTVTLEEVGNSLVAVAAPNAVPKAAAAPKEKPSVAEAAVTPALDALVSMVLRYNTLRAYSNTELAELLAVREDVDIPSAILHKKLKTLRETSSAASAKCYDAPTKRWRWRE
jgi:hypothetical protein